MLVLYIILGLIALFVYILLGRLTEKLLCKVGFDCGPMGNTMIVSFWWVMVAVGIPVVIGIQFYKVTKLIVG